MPQMCVFFICVTTCVTKVVKTKILIDFVAQVRLILSLRLVKKYVTAITLVMKISFTIFDISSYRAIDKIGHEYKIKAITFQHYFTTIRKTSRQPTVALSRVHSSCLLFNINQYSSEDLLFTHTLTNNKQCCNSRIAPIVEHPTRMI